MEREEFKRIDKYIEDVEENLEQWPDKSVVMERHLTKLHLVVKRLMHLFEDTKDQQLKTSLSTLEHRARRCIRCIETGHTN